MDKTLRIWDTNEMCVVENFKMSTPIYTHDLAKAIKHTLTAVGTKDGIVTICDMNSGSSSHILKRHKKPVMTVQWSPSDEYTLATGSQDNQILFWDIRKARCPLVSLDQHNGSQGKNSTAHNGYVLGLQFTTDGLFLISSGSDQRLRLWDVSSTSNMLINYGRIPHSFKNQTHHFSLTPPSLSFTPHLLVPSHSDVSIYELFTGKTVSKLKGHYSSVTSIDVNSNDIEVYTGSTDNTVLIWTPVNSIELNTESKLSRQSVIYNDTWSDED
ncbi:PREDICTED: DNA excision repair protein ERCC-8-like isoform X1 [Amphimedon queenslandica]|uniref:Uncharacterized protein n=2 Tax=Amphimedon queenslandica TaxID=400682 RepID=A0A1X7SLI9_AMPQE|nr:PREDICTED: DNA excision repair protein ERCC-8-like isoform X1 [Amphimedon queenslandica]|eukprot:XP_019863463.1 PREDICTED: DNA excision repair protein ERCC-8-like isoform X1 [Amphimedon queenslandica]